MIADNDLDWAVRDHDEQLRRLHPRRDRPDEIESRGVTPMEILKHQEER